MGYIVSTTTIENVLGYHNSLHTGEKHLQRNFIQVFSLQLFVTQSQLVILLRIVSLIIIVHSLRYTDTQIVKQLLMMRNNS